MSLRDTRDIGTAKIVMLGGGGGGSYTAGSGISISNSVITNIRKGALTGVIDSISSGYAHTQMTGARDTFTAGALIVVQSEASGSATNLRIQYGSQASDSQDFRFYDTVGQTTTLTIASGETINAMIDSTGYRAIVLSQYKAVAVDANTGTATAELKKLKVGSTVYNADAIKHYSATAISSGSISVSVPNAGHLNGEIIAVNTGSLTGTTSNAWTLVLSDGMTIEALTVSKADGTAFTDAITANELLFIKCNTSNDTAVLLGIAGASGGGGGLPENPLSIVHGGTGNTDGYIRTGQEYEPVGEGATAEGTENDASGDYAHAEGSYNVASGDNSHAEGNSVIASGNCSHAEGTYYSRGTSDPGDDFGQATGEASHSEGAGCHATGRFAHAEGLITTASGDSGSHAEGYKTTASGADSHAEGYNTTASSACTHAGGTNSVASGSHSFAHGQYVNAGYAQQAVFGRYNDNKSTTLLEVGKGTGSNNRSNAFEIYADGKVSFDNGVTKYQLTSYNGDFGFYDASGTFHTFSGGGGATSLASLSDTAISTPTNGQVLGYNSTSGKWENQNPSGGSIISKNRYTITASSWSNSVDADGYYTYTISNLNPELSLSWPPSTDIAGVNDSTFSTDAEKEAYDLLDECNLTDTDTLILYAKTKPETTFYIWVEGEVAS